MLGDVLVILAILGQQEHRYQAVTVPSGFRRSASRSAVNVASQNRQSRRVVMAFERARIERLQHSLVLHGPALDVSVPRQPLMRTSGIPKPICGSFWRLQSPDNYQSMSGALKLDSSGLATTSVSAQDFTATEWHGRF